MLPLHTLHSGAPRLRVFSGSPERMRSMFPLVLATAALAVLSACDGAGASVGTGLDGDVLVDGSSTVLRISEAVAEEFRFVESGVNVTVGSSGTGGGFEKFCRNETDVNDASRPIQAEEVLLAKESGVEFLELPIAYDGIAVVVNRANTFVDTVTVGQLKKVWQSGSTVKTWRDVDPTWPDREIKLFAPGVDSGTFDYFTETVNGAPGNCRDEFTASEDDHFLVQGVAGDADAFGFFGFAYYADNRDKLKLVPVEGEAGAVLPSAETIADGSYAPLSRPLFIYVRQSSLENPQVIRFVEFYLDHVAKLAAEVGYVGLPDPIGVLVKRRFDDRKTGSMFTEQRTLSLRQALTN